MTETPRLSDGRIDLDKPRWTQDTFIGRVKHFASITDMRNVFVTNQKLLEAKHLLELYRNKEEPKGTTEENIWKAKKLYESAFHPDSGELQNVIGRMSFQVPGGMILTAAMLQFYNTTSGVIISQWLNQSFNALVNYTNRNAASQITTKQMGVAYISATTSALVTAIGFKNFMLKRAPPIMQRFVPFLAVAAANCVNIPLTRQTEVTDGIKIFNEKKEEISESRLAALKGISLVALSRIIMAAPGMLTMPLIMHKLESKSWFMKRKNFHLLFQTIMIGCFLVFMVPISCAMFPQNCSISTETMKNLENEKYKKALERCEDINITLPKILYFNKGL